MSEFMKTEPTNNPKKTPTDILGQFFHSVKDGRIQWQGHVIGDPEPGWYLVQLFEWLGGSPNAQRLVRIEDMADWLFYDCIEDLEYSYKRGVARDGGPYRKPETRPV